MFEPKDAEKMLMITNDLVECYDKCERIREAILYMISFTHSVVLKVDETYQTSYTEILKFIEEKFKLKEKKRRMRKWLSLFGLL